VNFLYVLFAKTLKLGNGENWKNRIGYWFLHTCRPRVLLVIWMWSKDQGFVVEENCLRGLVGLKETIPFFPEFGRLLDGLEADTRSDLEIIDDWPLKTRDEHEHIHVVTDL